MFELRGKYNNAKVFTDRVDNTMNSQIIEFLNQEYSKDSVIRIMPDCHAGKGCVIGTTMTIHGKVNVNMVGVDIGCGMLTIPLVEKEIDFAKLDEVIRKHIPSGASVHQKEQLCDVPIEQLVATTDLERIRKSVGSLGGGNHFIEIDKDDENNLYLVIHSGSRSLGTDVVVYHQHKAVENLQIANENVDCMAYLKGSLLEDYLHDMKITQEYAKLNRKVMALAIVENMGFDKSCFNNAFETIHNYIDFKDNVLRKGAVSAHKGEKLLIPMNMRDGSLICVGKGNKDWNCSAPHGAGRMLSRSEAKAKISIEEYKEAMKGIFTTSVSNKTLDESPMVYKPMDEIIANIEPTVDIVKVIKPVYNFKAH